MTTVDVVLANAEELIDPLFVVGCPRSGTTVLARAIGLSNLVCYVEETQLIPKLYNRQVPIIQAIRDWRNGEALSPVLKGKMRRVQERLTGRYYLQDLIAHLVRYTKVGTYDLRPIAGHLINRYEVALAPQDIELARQLHRKYVDMGKKEDLDRMLRILFKDFQLLSGKSKILEKTPTHAFYTKTLKRIFPGSKICFIARDGRDVAASYMLNHHDRKIDKKSIRYICRTYRRIRSIDETLSNMNSPGYYRVQYEDLVSAPDAVIKRVFEFFGLPLSERVLDALEEVEPTPSNWQQLPEQTRKYVDACLSAG
jgi:hypothetical protein